MKIKQLYSDKPHFNILIRYNHRDPDSGSPAKLYKLWFETCAVSKAQAINFAVYALRDRFFPRAQSGFFLKVIRNNCAFYVNNEINEPAIAAQWNTALGARTADAKDLAFMIYPGPTKRPSPTKSIPPEASRLEPSQSVPVQPDLFQK